MATVRKPPTRAMVGDPEDPHGVPVLVNRYLDHLRVRNYSENTVVNCASCFHLFFTWCEERSILRPGDVTRPILERYQRYLYRFRQLNGKPLSIRTQLNRLVPLRGFFRWLARERYIVHNPASELELPRPLQKLPKTVLSASEAEQVLNQADVGNPLGIRDRAMMETLYSTGIRRMELMALETFDVDAERGWVRIRDGKGGKERIIPIGDRALAWIEKYLTDVRPVLASENESTLFLTNQGESFTAHRLSQMVHRYIDAAQIGKRGSCHVFRHTAATLMLENGADIRYIQEMLGHSNLKTTQIYTRVSIQKLKEIHAATHPARLGRSRRVDLDNDEPVTVEELMAQLFAEAAEDG